MASYAPLAFLPRLQSPDPDGESAPPYSQPHLLAPPAPWGTGWVEPGLAQDYFSECLLSLPSVAAGHSHSSWLVAKGSGTKWAVRILALRALDPWVLLDTLTAVIQTQASARISHGPHSIPSGYHPFFISARPSYMWEPEHNCCLLNILCRFLFNKTQFLWLSHPLVSPISP